MESGALIELDWQRAIASLADLRSAALLMLLAAGGLTAPHDVGARPLNGFDISGALIEEIEILHGGPARDGIPALDGPRLQASDEADWRGEEMVVGVRIGNESRAYPIAMLVAHELVNDVLGGVPILVSYCPLCGSALVFDRRIPDASKHTMNQKPTHKPAYKSTYRPTYRPTHRPTTFGVSGLLYRSDLLMYDRRSESLWSQILGRAVTGPMAGRELRIVPSSQLTWSAWRARSAGTTILSRKTGYRRGYGRFPYGDYETSRRLLYPAPVDPTHHPKMRTLGLRWKSGRTRAYPLGELKRAGVPVKETIGGHEIVVGYDATALEFQSEVPDDVDVIETYWFAWMAFYPESSVYRAAE